jgi:RHS repeat-associated protein
MGTVRYTVVNGQVIAENRNGVRKTYVPDPSGSTIALLDDKQKITDTFSYSPFGELKSRTGTTPTPFQYIGTKGYYTDPNNRIYVRARTYQPNYARWMTVDPLWPGESAYGYVRGNPVSFSDPLGRQTQKRAQASWMPSCDELKRCLKRRGSPYGYGSDTCSCVSRHPNDYDMDLALCVFWQETNLGQRNPDGGIGRCTEFCFRELIRLGCSWLKLKFQDYNDFKRRATPCEKARAAFDYLGCAGLIRYGPGSGKPGDYRGTTGTRVRKCADCLQMPSSYFCWIPVPPTDPLFNELQCRSCLSIVHP